MKLWILSLLIVVVIANDDYEDNYNGPWRGGALPAGPPNPHDDPGPEHIEPNPPPGYYYAFVNSELRNRVGLGYDRRTLTADSLRQPLTRDSFAIVDNNYWRRLIENNNNKYLMKGYRK